MNQQEAEAWFAQYRVGAETVEQTHTRLSSMPNNMAWHARNHEAFATIRRSRAAPTLQINPPPATPQRMDPMAFIQQFEFRNRRTDPSTQLDQTPDQLADIALDAMAPSVETKAEKRKRLDRERKQRKRAAESADRAAARRQSDAVGHELARARESQAQTEARRQSDAVGHELARARESPSETEARRQSDAVRHDLGRAAESPAQTAERIQRIVDAQRARRAQHLVNIRGMTRDLALQANTDENAIVEHYCGPMNVNCQFCGSFNFIDEKPSDNKFTKCCNKGKMVPKNPTNEQGVPLVYPEFLEQLLTDRSNPDYKNFREHIRSYNSSVSFASFGATLHSVPGRGPYVFKVQGQVYHFTSHMEPRSEGERSYAQLYVLDSSTQAVDTRLRHPAMEDCRAHILRSIHDFFRQNNRLARTYEMMREVQQREELHAFINNLEIPIVQLSIRSDRQQDERRFNLPTSNEIAMVFVNEDGEPPYNRDIRVYPRNLENPNHPLIRLNIRDCNLDPMVYALMFPYGQPGWHPDFLSNGVRQTMLQYKRSLTAIRHEFSPIMRAGNLSHQWVVDSYLQVEAHNLEYARHHQDRLRADLYTGLQDYVNTRAAAAGQVAGRAVILPSSFEGSPRNMQQRLHDAMAIFGKFGPPDLFITFTANPKWKEVQENLKPGETAGDRFDLICRVFQIKLNALIKDLTVNHALGTCLAYVLSIEFQKRGLPHAHILIVLHEADKFKTVARIDEVVCAELPDPDAEPILYSMVVNHMLHGPCGEGYPNAPCKGEDGLCSKRFPKEYRPHTEVNSAGTGYPAYRRRDGSFVIKNNYTFGNNRVVPYNKFLLLKYNSHINVEVCTSLKAIKYIYKYIYKGFDCANCTIAHVDGDEVLIHDEITNFANARYVSAPEGFWRLMSFPMHNRSHAVIQLPVHLPDQQRIYFEEGREEEALEAARSGETKLTAWFRLNRECAPARQYLYNEIPPNFVFKNNKWTPRQQGIVVVRMYTVPASDEERFCLRLLLLHVPGATSFKDLRRYNGVLYATFKQCAIQRKLLSSDEEFDRALAEAATFQMPYQLRQTFAIICVFCRPQNALALFEKYTDDMILDFLRRRPPLERPAAINLALHELQSVFNEHRTTCSSFNLPTPTGTFAEALDYVQTAEADKAARLISTLNVQQREAFDKISQSISDPQSHKLFYLNGPGGSGKTYLYQTLISYVRGRGQTVHACATTGIAATLMDGGTTIHSGFGLPIDLNDTSVSSTTSSSVLGKKLKDAAVLIIDEITMLNKHGLRVIDKLLREEIMRNNTPFGGKTVVISGDFRQTLPIVPRGHRGAIIEVSIVRSGLWQHFRTISLINNMRSAGQNQHNQWLLNIGSGNTPRIPGLPETAVEIPLHMIAGEDIVEKTFTSNVRSLSIDELSRRVVLASTNSQTLRINEQIMNQLDGQMITYTSSDEIVSQGNTNQERLYPVEFLNAQTPSGVPPHKLSLKLGAVVMLIRNLNRSKGLCNGSRLIVRGLYEHFINCEILSASHQGETVFISRLDITPSDTALPFQMKRRQFPLIPAFAITINKSQGQTYDIVGIHLNEPVFGHGQLYVALSRCKHPENLKLYIKEGAKQGQLLNDGRYFTQNVVYREVFD